MPPLKIETNVTFDDLYGYAAKSHEELNDARRQGHFNTLDRVVVLIKKELSKSDLQEIGDQKVSFLTNKVNRCITITTESYTDNYEMFNQQLFMQYLSKIENSRYQPELMINVNQLKEQLDRINVEMSDTNHLPSHQSKLESFLTKLFYIFCCCFYRRRTQE